MTNLLALAAPLALLVPLIGQGAALVEGTAGAGPEIRGAMDGAIGATSGDMDRAGPLSGPVSGPVSAPTSGPDFEQPTSGPYAQGIGGASPLEAFHQRQIARQVRIEQRVIVRISPQRSTSNRNSLLAELPRRSLATRFEEREMDNCVPVGRIAGVQTGTGNRLLLYLRDERIISLNLERACRARDFYSGFYIERSEDGQLCVARDELQSRSGARCEVERMRQLVAITE